MILWPSDTPRLSLQGHRSCTNCYGNQIPYLVHICFRTILTLSMFHIGRKVALDAQAAALVYICTRISQIAEMTLSFYVTPIVPSWRTNLSILVSEHNTVRLQILAPGMSPRP